jgi:bacillithiol synthase
MDYLEGNEELKPFYSFTPDANGIEQAIALRPKYPIDRSLLSQTLKKQYSSLPQQELVNRNIELLAKENCFTICTAHQPNLLTGYLYFIYKIIHAIKLAEDLKAKYPDKDFVPVYYMGSEDNDLEELGTFRYEGKKFVWDGDGQTGAVGRMDTKSLKPLLAELKKLLGPPGPVLDSFSELLTEAYEKQKTIGAATQYLVHALFGRYGLIVLDPDEAVFKNSIAPIIKDDLLNHTANGIVSKTIAELSHYKSQAHPRPVNLFYLDTQLRERIERNGDHWQVLNTEISVDRGQLLQLVDNHPERFSPNVILRGLLQETILPNVAFIGGGAEVAYWLQLRQLFKHYNVFYPVILLRQSALWIMPEQAKLRTQTGISIEELFMADNDLVRTYVARHGANNWDTATEMLEMEKLIAELKAKAIKVDKTLGNAAEAVAAKMAKLAKALEQKMLRAEKRKMETGLARLHRLKDKLFPNHSLQERVENFTGYYLQYGDVFFDTLKDATHPLGSQFVVIEHQA